MLWAVVVAGNPPRPHYTDKPLRPQCSRQLCPQTEMTVNGYEEQQPADGHLKHTRKKARLVRCPSLSAFITA